VIHASEKKPTRKRITKVSEKNQDKKKQTTTKPSEKKPTRKKQTQPSKKERSIHCCVTVFHTGATEYFISEEEARITYQRLPSGIVKEYKIFDTVGEATSFIEQQGKGFADKKTIVTTVPKKITRSVGKKTIVTSVPVTPDDMARKMQTLKAMSLKSGPYVPVATSTSSPMKSGSSNNSSYIKNLQRRAHCMNNKLRVFVCKFDTGDEQIPEGYVIPEKQVIVIDMHDEPKDATYWTHKPRTWVNMFQEAKARNPDMFDDECYLLQSFQFRDVTSGMKNNGKSFHYTTARSNEMNIPVDGLFAMVPFDWTSVEILDYVTKIGRNMMTGIAKEGYKAMYPNAASNFKTNIDFENGSYWKTLEAVFEKECISILKIEALAEILGDDAVFMIMGELFDEKRPMNEWTDPFRMMYAYKNLLDAPA
jgi:flagellum-specific peptidoglycan hydrolase FlgJ